MSKCILSNCFIMSWVLAEGMYITTWPVRIFYFNNSNLRHLLFSSTLMHCWSIVGTWRQLDCADLFCVCRCFVFFLSTEVSHYFRVVTVLQACSFCCAYSLLCQWWINKSTPIAWTSHQINTDFKCMFGPVCLTDLSGCIQWPVKLI